MKLLYQILILTSCVACTIPNNPNKKDKVDIVESIDSTKVEAIKSNDGPITIVNPIDSINKSIEDEISSFSVNSELNQAQIEFDSIIDVGISKFRYTRIFGYKSPNNNSEKILLISEFTTDNMNNPFNCPLGVYYETQEMFNEKGLYLKFVDTINGFSKVNVLKSDKIIETIYIKNKWIEF